MLNAKVALIILLLMSCCGFYCRAEEVELSVSAGSTKEKHAVPSEMIIELKKGVVDMCEEKGVVSREKVDIKSESIKALNGKYGLVSIERLFSGTRKDEASDIYVFRFSPQVNINKAISAYKEDVNVLYVEPNYTVHAE